MTSSRSSCCRFIALSIFACCTTLVGCGGPKIAPVEGTITLDGKGLDKIYVEFWPQTEGPRSFGQTDDQGHFVLKTDDGKANGAVLGNHKVVLKDSSVLGDKFMGRAAENKDISGGRKPRISNSYTGADTTPISQVVEASGNKFTIEVKAK